MNKGVVGLNIPRIGRVISIWYEVFFKLRVSFDGIVSSKKVFSEPTNRIEIQLDAIVEFLEVQSSVSFQSCLGEEFINFDELISCLRFHMPPFFAECPPSNGESL